MTARQLARLQAPIPFQPIRLEEAMSDRRGEKVAIMAGSGVLLWWLLRKGRGWPFGAGSAGGDARPCRLRLSGAGLVADGKPATVAEAVRACQASRRAELFVAGDAVWGKLEEVRRALRAAGVAIAERVGSAPPANGQKKPARGKRVSRSSHDASGTVRETPAALLAQAQVFVPDLTLDEYTAARLAASEHGSGSIVELAAIIDAELNRAERRGVSLFGSLTWKGTFGKQGSRRRASTRLDPHEVHLEVARDVLSGRKRGISQGATRFFDPRVQLALARKGKACPPLVILERWAFDFPWLKEGGKRKGCQLDRRKPGRDLSEWVGEIEGIDPTRLMLMRPAVPGPEHVRRYLAAKEVIETRLLGGKTYA
jgi:hypothetical protein